MHARTQMHARTHASSSLRASLTLQEYIHHVENLSTEQKQELQRLRDEKREAERVRVCLCARKWARAGACAEGGMPAGSRGLNQTPIPKPMPCGGESPTHALLHYTPQLVLKLEMGRQSTNSMDPFKATTVAELTPKIRALHEDGKVG